MSRLITPITIFLVLLASQLLNAEQKRNYSYLYFENGYPTSYSMRRPESEANLTARENPDLVFQTGYYSLMLGCDDLQIKGYNALTGTDYRTALNQDVTLFTPATSLLLEVVQGGVSYQCTHAIVQSPGLDSPVRLIEGGQYLQRIDHLGLVFKDANGNTLQAHKECRLEISAWADRVTFFLDFSSETSNPIAETTIRLISPSGVTHLSRMTGTQSRLTLKPHEDQKLSALELNRVTKATNLRNGVALPVSYDPDVHALKIDVPADPISYPADKNRVDEYLVELANPSNSAENIPLIFNQPSPRGITGTSMVLCDADSGRPLGIPVQISKNWHSKSVRTKHDGPWLRGSTLLTLQAGEARRFKLRVIYGYWGGAGAISHAQLSLIGWGGNWMWDQSALGSWGESMTYDPSLHLGSAFLDDIRPAFTRNSQGNTHAWTENVGGGDFLIYRDQTNKYRWLKRQKICYLQTGPNLTEVHYGGITDDDKIRVTYTSKAISTSDYNRRFYDYKYEFLQNVVTPSRLVFHQMAADYYLTPTFTNYNLGNGSGLLSTETIEAGGNAYKGSPIPMDGKWLSIDDITGANEQARAMRGIIPLSTSLNGNPLPLHIHKYGRNYGAATMLFDFSADTVTRSYTAGDVVNGAFEFILPPQHVNHYWGEDTEFASRLTSYGDTSWEPVRDEMLHNIQMNISMHSGSLVRNYPLEIQPALSGNVLADFTINAGGIGHVPVLLKNAAAGLSLKVQRWSNGSWVVLESVDIQKNNYYQALRNPDGTCDYTFSIRRPTTNLSNAWRARIMYDVISTSTGKLDMLLLLPETKVTDSVSLSANSSAIVDLNIGISGESHPGSFSILNGVSHTIDPSLNQSKNLNFQFDYALANQIPSTSATGQITINWSERRSGGASGQIVIPISALALSNGNSGSMFTWDNTAGDGTTITEGSGIWQSGLGSWNDNGIDRNWSDGNQAIFGGGTTGNAGTIILNGNVVPTKLGFRTSAAGNYTIDLTNFNLITANASNAVEVIGSTSATIKATGSGRLFTPYSGSSNNFSLAGSLIMEAPVTGPGGVFAGGSGNLYFSNPTNNFTGIFAKQDSGDLAFSSISNSGLASAAGAGNELRIGQNARAVYTGSGNSSDRTFHFFGSGDGTLDNDGSGALIWGGNFLNGSTGAGSRKFILGGSNTNNNEFRGILVDHASNGNVLSLEKNDSGTWLLSGGNSYTGTTTVSQGTLRVSHDRALGSTAAGTSVANDAKLQLDGSAGNLTIAENISLGSGSGALYNLSGANTLSGAITLTNNVDFRSNAGTVIFSGGINSLANQSLAINGVATFQSSPIDLNNGIFTITSANNHPANASYLNVGGNDWSLMRINFGGYLTLGGDNYLPDDADISFGWTDPGQHSGTLNLNATNQTVASVATNSAALGEVPSGGAQTITGGGTLTINQTINTEFQGIITDGATATSLVKKQLGTLTLSGANTYTGNTTINGGTLSITTASLADKSTVTISSGAVLNLAFTGSDTVRTLVIGNNQMPPGVYGVSAIDNPQITGIGTLTVPESFSSWITRNFANGTVSSDKRGIEDDPDGDGLNNLMEYSLGKDPTISSQPAGVLSDFVVTYTKGADAIANGDVSWIIETSETLTPESWTTRVSHAPKNTDSTIFYTFTPSALKKNFARLKVIRN